MLIAKNEFFDHPMTTLTYTNNRSLNHFNVLCEFTVFKYSFIDRIADEMLNYFNLLRFTVITMNGHTRGKTLVNYT